MEKLKILRKGAKLNQKQMAEILKMSQTNYGKYELGQTEPDIATLCKIADFYGVTLDYLCDHNSNQIELPALNESQKKLILAIIELNRDNFALAYGFVMALYQKQQMVNIGD